MKKILSTVALSTLLIACSQNNQPAQQSATDQAEHSSSNTATQRSNLNMLHIARKRLKPKYKP
jgi:heat shock protein HslJ